MATIETTRYGIEKLTTAPYEEAVNRVKAALKEQGFGVLTEIDVKRTLKEKLDKDVEPYVILGACNPPLAARSLDAEPAIGLLLPCNVIVAEREGYTLVAAVNPQSLVELSGNPDLIAVAHEVDRKLRAALDMV
jgi:uncharacterized protein (DUF302 family)